MFYGASKLIFKNAKHRRNHLTHSERVFWTKLKERFPLFRFRRQHPLSNYIADFYCHKFKLVIEVDGSIHQLEDVMKNDVDRQAAIESLGLNVIRFTNEDIKHRVEACLEKISDYISHSNK
jgi:imidazole glycerol-phosphate synthase subunit HisF